MSLPKNAKAQRLEGIFSHIFVREEFKENLEAILEEAQISIDSYVDSTYAESLLIIPNHRMREDCVVVDIGYYHTDVCIMRNGAPISHKTIQVGGAHFANDISYVIGVLPEEAESVKRRHVFGLDYSHRSDNYHMQDGSVVSFDYDHIQNIIEARANEIIDMVGDAIKKSPIDINANTPLFLCGGGMAMMRGGREFIQSRIGMMVSTELPPMPRRNSSNNISAYGVMVYQLENSSSSKQDWKDKSFIQSVLSFFTK